MSLVEAEATGPVEGDAPLVTPPRPPHRRVSVSLLFTLTVLTSTVVAIYIFVPTRYDMLMNVAIARHREPGGSWDRNAPSQAELRAWWSGVVGKAVALPPGIERVAGFRRLEVFDRDAALVRMQVGPDVVTCLVQRSDSVAPKYSERREKEAHAIAWRRHHYLVIVVGSEATTQRWAAAFH
ncbi:MAG: hypothetical protein AB7O24_26935 [Kofleriaceae bacterium]